MFEFDVVYDREAHLRGVMALNFNRGIVSIVLSVLIFFAGITWLVLELLGISSDNYGYVGTSVVFILVAVYYAVLGGLGLSEKYLRKAIDKLLAKNAVVYPKTINCILYKKF